MDKTKLRLVLLPGKLPTPQYSKDYQKAYDCWRSVWEDTYKNELKFDKKLTSDDFTRQDEIVTLFYGEECVGLSFMKWTSFENSTAKADSYFNSWTDFDLHSLNKEGKSIIVCSNFTISLDFRRGRGGFNWKDLLMCFLSMRLLYSNADAMTGTMRLSKGMGEATYRAGAVAIRKNVVFKETNDPVDLVGFYKSKIDQCGTDEVLQVAQEVWARVEALVNPVSITGKAYKAVA